jgi:hypothetical protein
LKFDLKDAFALFDAKEFLSKPVDIGTFKSMKKDFIYV